MIPINGMKAFKMLFAVANSVICAECGRDLMHDNYQRLIRRGCPKCGSKKVTYNFPEPVAARLRAQGIIQ